MDEKVKAQLMALGMGGLEAARVILTRYAEHRGAGPWFDALQAELLQRAQLVRTEGFSDEADFTTTMALKLLVEEIFSSVKADLEAKWGENDPGFSKLN